MGGGGRTNSKPAKDLHIYIARSTLQAVVYDILSPGTAITVLSISQNCQLSRSFYMMLKSVAQ